jgi:hypothetical protein
MVVSDVHITWSSHTGVPVPVSGGTQVIDTSSPCLLSLPSLAVSCSIASSLLLLSLLFPVSLSSVSSSSVSVCGSPALTAEPLLAAAGSWVKSAHISHDDLW